MRCEPLFFLALFCICSASGVRSASDINDFLQGLLEGLETNGNSEGSCYQYLVTAENEVMNVTSDVQKILAGDSSSLPQLFTDLHSLVSILQASNSDCQWTSLYAEIKSLDTSAGRDKILLNVLKNVQEIMKYAEMLPNCPTDWAVCGYNIAQIFSLIFNWKITLIST